MAAPDQYRDHRGTHQFRGLADTGLPQTVTDQLLLDADDMEGLVEALHPLLFLFVKPELEPLEILIPQLGIQLIVVDTPCPWVVDMTDTETEPPAITRTVGEELLLITCGTERGETCLLHTVTSIDPSLVDGLCRHQCLQFRHILTFNRLYLLDLHQIVLRNGEFIVLLGERVMGVLPEIRT